MRDILFRGKRIDNGEWVEGTLYQISTGNNPFIMLSNRHAESHEVDPESVGQFTGKSDRHGKRIFEGDICKINGFTYKVEFKYSEWILTILSKRYYCFPAFDSHCGEYCEVISNIYDNPELMEDK